MNDLKNITILLIDDSPERSDALLDALRICGYDQVSCITTNVVIWDELERINPDVVLIDVESPTRDTLEQLTLIRDRLPKPVVLFTQDQNVQSIRAAIQSGVSAYVLDDASPDRVRPAIEIAMATFRSFQQIRQERDEARAGLQDQKALGRAKSILIRRRGMSEDEAYHHIRKLAMRRHQRIGQTAKDIIEMEELIG